MSDQSTLGEKIREAIVTGRLPHEPPRRMWGGPAGGESCLICGVTLGADELGFEMEFAPGTSGLGGRSVYAHVPCFDAWKSERRRLDRDLSPSDSPGTLGSLERDVPRSRGSE